MARQTDPLRKRISRRAALVGPAKFLLGCVVLIFLVSIFLQVRRVEVRGNSHYGANEIIQAAGVEEGDNLFFVNRFAAVAGILAKLPYVESVSVTTQLPGTVILEVTESVGLAWAETGGERWIIDRSCKALTRAGDEEAASLIRVAGVTPQSPEVGETITAAEGADCVSVLADMLDQIQRRGMAGEVTGIDLTDVQSPRMEYGGRFTVIFGRAESMNYQFGKLQSAIAGLTAADRGTIDLSASGAAVEFTPF